MSGTTTIHEPAANEYEAEHRGLYQPVPTAHDGAIIQGSVDIPYSIFNHENDSYAYTYDVRLLVGPYWRDVQSVVPKVTIDAYYSTNPDQDDLMRWEIENIQWDTVGGLGPNNELRIRLSMRITLYGEYAQFKRLGYFVMASGRGLGEGGLSKPGPVKG